MKDVFHFDSFRGDQQAIVEGVLQGQSALVLMPTGMGKSLCYQLPSTLLANLTIVVSPLIALMQDQVDQAMAKGIPAVAIHSGVSKEEREQRYRELMAGQHRLLYVTPERFKKLEFLQAIGQRKIDLLAVDEAHCISQWGHDFRPEYSRLGEIRRQLGSPTTLALTATATLQVQREIQESLGIETAPIFHSGIRRPNLSLQVHDIYGLDEKIRGLVGLHFQNPGATIVYHSLITTLYKVSEELSRLGIEHLVYHGQLSAAERKRQQRLFLSEESSLILATPAFGLGIDKYDVRLLVHMEVPGSLESYYQEVGRAGRDGKSAQCHLFFDDDDVSIQVEFLKWANPEPEFILNVFYLIESAGPKLANDGIDFLRTQMNFYNRRDFRVETSLNLLERWGAIEPDKSRLGFRAIQPPAKEFLEALRVADRPKTMNRKLLSLVEWVKNTDSCRALRIYEYFAHQDVACGLCDVCLSQARKADD